MFTLAIIATALISFFTIVSSFLILFFNRVTDGMPCGASSPAFPAVLGELMWFYFAGAAVLLFCCISLIY
ncbi:hypothetical protein POPTR_003G015466v4 [Populus trichocarpa]|uniref:Uncharacterized protein n=1 Tax=Populus trichocarpa TaxID=3694 RepID=A0ACC0T710_POPTR|nr:hypothetical protein POPTR_003G015466v4 [Populus trichocarpa]